MGEKFSRWGTNRDKEMLAVTRQRRYRRSTPSSIYQKAIKGTKEERARKGESTRSEGGQGKKEGEKAKITTLSLTNSIRSFFSLQMK